MREGVNEDKGKAILKKHIVNYCTVDDLFELLEAIKVGIGILEREGFPMKEFAIFRSKDWIKKYEKKRK